MRRATRSPATGGAKGGGCVEAWMRRGSRLTFVLPQTLFLHFPEESATRDPFLIERLSELRTMIDVGGHERMVSILDKVG